jgi:hypothetical protein
MMEGKVNKNPYAPDTPEWQLWAGMEAARQLVGTYAADAARYTQKMDEARMKAEAYAAALEKLGASA